jgi:hypothetical protein
MASFTKFQKSVLNFGKGKFTFNTDTLKIALSNTAPSVSANEIISDITQITAANGYTAGGTAVPNVGWSQTSGTATLIGDQIVFTASGGSFGPLQYAVLYDSTTGFLLGYWDYGSAVTITTGNTFAVQPNGSTTAGTILTLV